MPCHLGHLGQSAVMKEEGKEIKGYTEKNSEGSKRKHRNKTLFEVEDVYL